MPLHWSIRERSLGEFEPLFPFQILHGFIPSFLLALWYHFLLYSACNPLSLPPMTFPLEAPLVSPTGC
jgi:hypothetical protein